MILVSGLWTPAAVFAMHSHWLQRRGYRVLRFGYSSMRATLSQNARRLQGFIAAQGAADGGADMHLVGHSLGGLVILDMLKQTPVPRLRRVVLLGTPCVGSHCARRLAAVAGTRALLGRSIREWLSRPPGAAVASRSAPAIGVLAGTRSMGLGRLVSGLPKPNDGVVAVAEHCCPAPPTSLR